MRILFICGSFFHALIPVNRVLKNCKGQIVILLSNQVMRHKSNFQTVKFIIGKSGFRYLLFKLLEDYLLKFAVIISGKRSRLKLWGRLAKEGRIKIVKFKNADDKEFLDKVRSIGPDIIVTLTFHKISQSTIEQPKICCINLHPGLLPQYRIHGGSFWPLINNDSRFGYTIHYVDANLDTGDILKREEFPIGDKDTLQTLMFKQFDYGADGLVEIINKISDNGQMAGIKQEEFGQPKSWSWPTSKDVSNLIDVKGRRLVRLKDIFRCIRGEA